MTGTLTKADLSELVTLVRAVGRMAVMPHFRTLRPQDIQAKTGALSWRFMPEPSKSQVCARLPRA